MAKIGKKYRQNYKTEIAEYRQNHKAEIAEYRQINKAKLVDQQKEYHRSHKAEYAAWNKAWHQTFSGQVSLRLRNAKYRCTNPNYKDYARYGGRGIKCLFTNLNDLMQHIIVDLGIDTVELLRGLVVHRIDNDSNYERGNIVLITRAEHNKLHWELRQQEKKE